MSLLAAGVALGGTVVFYTGVVVVVGVRGRARERSLRALARERDWTYHATPDLPTWYLGVPRPPNARGVVEGPTSCRVLFAGAHRGHRIELFEAAYPGGDEHLDYVCTVAALLDPPAGLPSAVGTALRASVFRVRPPVERFVVEPASDALLPVVETVAAWEEVELWGIGEVVWTVTKGECYLGDVDRQLDMLSRMVDALG